MSSTDPTEIFLQPECCADPAVGRLWCEDDSPEDCEDGVPWTRYILASAQSALIRELAEALRDARKWTRWFSSEPGSKHDEVLRRIDALLARAEKEQSNGR